MKKLSYLIITLTILITSCNDDEKENIFRKEGYKEINLVGTLSPFVGSDDSSLKINIDWQSNAIFGLFEYDKNAGLYLNSNREFTLKKELNLDKAEFQGFSQTEDGWLTSERIYYGYYPYNVNNMMASAIKFDLSISQTQDVENPTKHILSNSFLVCRTEVAGGNASEGLSFMSKTAVLEFALTNNTLKGIIIDKIIVKERSGNTIFKKSGLYNTMKDELVYQAEDQKDAVEVKLSKSYAINVNDSYSIFIATMGTTVPYGSDFVVEIHTDRGIIEVAEIVKEKDGLVFESGKLYTTEIALTEKLLNAPVTLSSSTNTYIINPPLTASEDEIKTFYLPITRANNFWKGSGAEYGNNPAMAVGEDDHWVAEIIWQDFDLQNKEVISFVEDMNKGTGAYDKIGFTVKYSNSDQYGNVVIGIRKADENGNQTGDYIWSWHLWVTDLDEKVNYITYGESNQNVMDRHLGAKNNIIGDVGALGLLYQWGRKDPFVGASATTFASDNDITRAETSIEWPSPVQSTIGGYISYVAQHPTTFVLMAKDGQQEGAWLNNFDHNGNIDFWNNDKKMFHDPCPDGWKVASRRTWNDFTQASFPYDNTNKGRLYNGIDWYPSTGGINPETGKLSDMVASGFSGAWSSGKAYNTLDPDTNPRRNYTGRSLSFNKNNNGVLTDYARPRAWAIPVRCIQFK